MSIDKQVFRAPFSYSTSRDRCAWRLGATIPSTKRSGESPRNRWRGRREIRAGQMYSAQSLWSGSGAFWRVEELPDGSTS